MTFRKIFMAGVVLLTSTVAFAKVTPEKPDGGVQVQKQVTCEGGFEVSPIEAAGFNVVFSSMIMTLIQVSNEEALVKMIPISEQNKVMPALVRLDTIASGEKSACFTVSPDEAKLILSHLLKMTDAITAAKGDPIFDSLVLGATHNDMKKEKFILNYCFHNVLTGLVLISKAK